MTVTASAIVRVNGDGFHVPGSHRSILVKKPAQNHRTVRNQFPVLPHEGVQAAEGVVEVVVADAVHERSTEQPTNSAQLRGVQEGCVADVNGCHGVRDGHDSETT